MNRLDLDSRVAVVTGAASGIGFAIAKRMLASGARVALWDMSHEGLDAAVASLGTGARAFVMDITDEAAVAKATQDTAQAFGRIDALVNSAGISGPNGTTWEYPVDTWRRVVDINLTGTFLVCRAIVPRMLERGYGRIVNIASIAGKEGNPNAPAYSASKAGVIGLTKSLGKELAQKNITVNAITPAAVRTPIFDQITQAHIDFMLSKIPMNRFGTVDEIAALVAWLCTEECSFSTGAVFDLSGGRATY